MLSGSPCTMSISFEAACSICTTKPSTLFVKWRYMMSAGIEMAMRLVQEINGADFAKAVQLGIEYDPDPPLDTGSPEQAPQAIVDLVSSAFQAREAGVRI